MDFQKIKTFFMWCTIINGCLLIYSVIIGIMGPDFVYMANEKLFQIPHESFNVIYYAFIGLYKIFWIFFNVVPYVALVIIGKK